MTDLPETVTIPTRDYLNLVRRDLELDVLEAGGVDNWEGYGEGNWDSIEAGAAEVEATLPNPHPVLVEVAKLRLALHKALAPVALTLDQLDAVTDPIERIEQLMRGGRR